ncbi:hypothetical protein MC885_008292 [Smutsia gigantea]|nr:hypothetical protein MC885_008292 [Smutsia gigantea]
MLHSSRVRTLSVRAARPSSLEKVEGNRSTRLCPLRSSTSSLRSSWDPARRSTCRSWPGSRLSALKERQCSCK